MATRYGMHESLANLSLEQGASPLLPVPGLAGARNYREHTAQAIDEAVREIVAAAFKRALDLLAQSRGTLERTANLLLERETLVEVDLSAIAAQVETQRQETGATSTT